jgi:uncharacterized OB-fold protein
MLPVVTPLTEAFWTGGARGELRIQRCRTCGRHLHPPGPVCRVCLSRELTAEVVSGRGTVHTFTVNHQAWRPDLDEPYVIAVVELVDAPGVRLLTNIVDCDPEDVVIGLPVRVRFEDHGDVHLPLFVPVP